MNGDYRYINFSAVSEFSNRVGDSINKAAENVKSISTTLTNLGNYQYIEGLSVGPLMEAGQALISKASQMSEKATAITNVLNNQVIESSRSLDQQQASRLNESNQDMASSIRG